MDPQCRAASRISPKPDQAPITGTSPAHGTGLGYCGKSALPPHDTGWAALSRWLVCSMFTSIEGTAAQTWKPLATGLTKGGSCFKSLPLCGTSTNKASRGTSWMPHALYACRLGCLGVCQKDAAPRGLGGADLLFPWLACLI